MRCLLWGLRRRSNAAAGRCRASGCRLQIGRIDLRKGQLHAAAGKNVSAAALLALALAGGTCSEPRLGPPQNDGRLLPETGTIETLAGPAFCPTESTPRRETGEIRSLTVSPEGALWFETGPADRPLIGRVDETGAATAAPRPGSRPIPGSPAVRPGRLRGSSLSWDGQGVVLATHTSIALVDKSVSLLAGRTSEQSRTDELPNGDGGPYRDAHFRQIASVTTDAQGNVYAADRGYRRSASVAIRFLNRATAPVKFYEGTGDEITVEPGHIQTIIGGDSRVPAGDSPDIALLRGEPPTLAAAGPSLYLASLQKGRGSSSTTRVGVLNLSGDVLTTHGVTVKPGKIGVINRGRSGFAGDGGPVRRARFSLITGMAVSEVGDLYVADQLNHRIRRIDPGGRVSTLAGSGPVGERAGGFNGNDIRARAARLDNPSDVKIGPRGVYFADSGNGQVRLVDDSGMIRALPGKGAGGTPACVAGKQKSGALPSETFAGGVPFGIAAGAGKRIFFSDRVGGRVHEIVASGHVRKLAGVGIKARDCGVTVACPVEEDIPATRAELRGPADLAPSADGLYVLDAADFRVRFLNLTRRPVSVHGKRVRPGRIVTVAGNGTLGSSGDGGAALAAQIDPDQATMAADRRGNLYLSDPRHQRLRLIDSRGRISSILSPDRKAGGDGCCKYPQGLATDRRGNLVISETLEVRIWYLNLGKTTLTRRGRQISPGNALLVAGKGPTAIEHEGGPAADTPLLGPIGLAVDGRDNIYVADRDTHFLFRIDSAGAITTLAGTGQTGFNGDGLKGRLTRLHEPHHLDFDRCGNLVFTDAGNGRVRRLTLSRSC